MTGDEFAAIDSAGLWIGLDVVQEAFGIKRSAAYKLARQEGWRTAPGQYPKQYSFTDVKNTYRTRKDQQ